MATLTPDDRGDLMSNKHDLRLDTPIQFVKGVGPKLGEIFRNKGVETVKDLLEWYPRAYEDRRAARNIASLRPEEFVSLKAQVVKVSSFQMGRSSRKIYDVTVRDSTGKIHCKFFRVPYKGYFERFQPNQWVRVIGKVTHYRGQIEFHHPDLQDDTVDGQDDDVLLPIYPESEGLTNRQIRKFIEQAMTAIKQNPFYSCEVDAKWVGHGAGGGADSGADGDGATAVLGSDALSSAGDSVGMAATGPGTGGSDASTAAGTHRDTGMPKGGRSTADLSGRTATHAAAGVNESRNTVGKTVPQTIGHSMGSADQRADQRTSQRADQRYDEIVKQNIAKREQASRDESSKRMTMPLEPLDKFPQWMREKYQLPDRLTALDRIHNPLKTDGADFVDLSSPYHRRIIFEEFFWLELYLAARKSGLKKESAPQLKKDYTLVKQLSEGLPFKLTNAQKNSFKEIAEDLAKPHPMHRLVQGDVGSGKTMVALMASALAVQNGFQSAIMVPTEILAEQHYQNAKKFLEPLGITIGLLTGSMKTAEKNQTLDLLKKGLIQICVGTHALIQETVDFHKLGLVIVDEQHRFGVHQRSRLKQKGLSPHFLVMTATPIPRTLAMTVYGDLDVSVIDELPAGRSPIVTRVAYESARPKMLNFLRDQIRTGRQAYVVYPLIEESEKIDLKDAISQFERLKTELPDFKIDLLHGRMKPAEKDDVMRRFRAHEFDILVATTVIEVGVDVPNANLMIIEHSERFGLSQLHQLRGRVGRGQHKSYCVLMLGKAVSDESRTRAQIMEKTTDGFKIAEADLEIRGPGEFLGTRQSGLPGFKLANLVRDVKILQEARQAAFEALSVDPNLRKKENETLREELLKAHGPTALASVG